MANAGFFEQKSVSPTRFALVVGAHAAVLGAVMFAAGPQFIRPRDPPIIVTPVSVPQPPPARAGGRESRSATRSADDLDDAADRRYAASAARRCADR